MRRDEIARWVRTRPVKPDQKLILMLVFDYAGQQEDGSWAAWPGLEQLREDSGYTSVATVRKRLVELEKLGLVKREPRVGRNGRQTSNRIVLLAPADTVEGAPAGAGEALHVERGEALPLERVTPLKLQKEALFPDGQSAQSAEITTTQGKMTVIPMTYERRPVPLPVVVDAVSALDYWNCCTGQSYRPYDGTGAPTASLRVIVGAMLKFPEVRRSYQDMVTVALRRPWWKDDAPDTGVVFGPNVVQRVLQRVAGVGGDTIVWETG